MDILVCLGASRRLRPFNSIEVAPIRPHHMFVPIVAGHLRVHVGWSTGMSMSTYLCRSHLVGREDGHDGAPEGGGDTGWDGMDEEDCWRAGCRQELTQL